MSRLLESQMEFARAVAKLLKHVGGLTTAAVTLGDAYRDPRCPYGSKNSKHHRRLALDLNLFLLTDGKWEYQTGSHAHEIVLGKYWESLGGIWGGRWDPPDGNHYEWPEEDSHVVRDLEDPGGSDPVSGPEDLSQSGG
jgi:hypothetical protein